MFKIREQDELVFTGGTNADENQKFMMEEQYNRNRQQLEYNAQMRDGKMNQSLEHLRGQDFDVAKKGGYSMYAKKMANKFNPDVEKAIMTDAERAMNKQYLMKLQNNN